MVIAGTDMVVGAGTVYESVAARISIMNGAKFIVALPSMKRFQECATYTLFHTCADAVL